MIRPKAAEKRKISQQKKTVSRRGGRGGTIFLQTVLVMLPIYRVSILPANCPLIGLQVSKTSRFSRLPRFFKRKVTLAPSFIDYPFIVSVYPSSSEVLFLQSASFWGGIIFQQTVSLSCRFIEHNIPADCPFMIQVIEHHISVDSLCMLQVHTTPSSSCFLFMLQVVGHHRSLDSRYKLQVANASSFSRLSLSVAGFQGTIFSRAHCPFSRGQLIGLPS